AQVVPAAVSLHAAAQFAYETAAGHLHAGVGGAGLHLGDHPPLVLGVLSEPVEQDGLSYSAQTGQHHAAVVLPELAAYDEQVEVVDLLVAAFQCWRAQSRARREGVQLRDHLPSPSCSNTLSIVIYETTITV